MPRLATSRLRIRSEGMDRIARELRTKLPPVVAVDRVVTCVVEDARSGSVALSGALCGALGVEVGDPVLVLDDFDATGARSRLVTVAAARADVDPSLDRVVVVDGDAELGRIPRAGLRGVLPAAESAASFVVSLRRLPHTPLARLSLVVEMTRSVETEGTPRVDEALRTPDAARELVLGRWVAVGQSLRLPSAVAPGARLRVQRYVVGRLTGEARAWPGCRRSGRVRRCACVVPRFRADSSPTRCSVSSTTAVSWSSWLRMRAPATTQHLLRRRKRPQSLPPRHPHPRLPPRSPLRPRSLDSTSAPWQRRRRPLPGPRGPPGALRAQRAQEEGV